jgi:two-component system sensor kinase FixL
VIEALPELKGQGIVELLDKIYLRGEPFIAREMPIKLQRLPDSAPETRFVTFAYVPVRSAQGEVVGIFCEGYDVTDAKRDRDEVSLLQEELIESSKSSAMALLGSALAHELNQPLTAITNYVGASTRLLQREPPETAAVLDAMQKARESALRAGELINRLRQTFEGGRTVVRWLNLSHVIRDTKVAAKARNADPELEYVEVVEPDVWVLANQVQVQQLLLNLSRNATEAMEGASRKILKLEVVQLDGKAMVSISDSGSGLSQEVKDRLFEPFASSKSQGMGIGLAICRTIVEAHGGQIWTADSDYGGARFAFTLRWLTRA